MSANAMAFIILVTAVCVFQILTAKYVRLNAQTVVFLHLSFRHSIQNVPTDIQKNDATQKNFNDDQYQHARKHFCDPNKWPPGSIIQNANFKTGSCEVYLHGRTPGSREGCGQFWLMILKGRGSIGAIFTSIRVAAFTLMLLGQETLCARVCARVGQIEYQTPSGLTCRYDLLALRQLGQHFPGFRLSRS